MPPDFSGQNLRGRNFKGQDLTEANFSYADIRGANFTSAVLKGANFTGAKAGVQKRWVVGQLLISFVLSVFSGSLQGYFGWYIAYYFQIQYIEQFSLVPAVTITIIYIAFFVATIRQGFTVKAFTTIAVTVTVTGAGAVAVIGTGAGAVAIAGAVAGAGAVAVAGTGASMVAVTVVGAVAVAITGAVAVIVAVAGAGTVVATVAVAGTSAVIVAVVTVLFSFYVARQALKGDEKFALIHTFGVAFGALGGTRFYKADLTGANFSNATLKSSNFREATLTHVCWKDAKKLDRARVGNSILSNSSVRELLITRNGYKKTYRDTNLRGANLNGVNLNTADLTWADLSEVTLHRADLSHANLREVLAVGADFSNAHLTGACLQSWNIDSTTILKDVDCQYVFLLEQPNQFGSRERRPHDANKLFQPGDFEKFFKEILDTVQILIRDGINPDAFKVALQTVLEKYPDAAVQGIEKQDNDVLLTLKVPAGTNKEEVEQDWDQVYQARLEAQKNAALLEAKQQHVDDLKAIILSTVSNPNSLLSNLIINTTANNTAMNQSNNPNLSASQGSFINTGDLDITGSTINLGEISGNVTHTINQLQNTDRPYASELSSLLKQLQEAIEQNPDLSVADKTEALEQVSTLAKAGENPQDGTLKKLANTAIKVIKGTVVAVPATATLVEAVNQLLPTIASLLGL